ncbi:myo-inosose-2 dehydratase [uncultured Roseobacter sp.]|uniref:myo-inosose-2 dehydratase n=1 Tax=uncultured Roseobacter sp. TaxID=114847 RepID=UPI0026282B73|nr:myo-inosose-2 dehydratase [uncultured Roseobacter sp.]
MTLKLGISPLSWTNEAILDLGDHIPLAQCLSEAAMAGFTGVELGRKFPALPEAILRVLTEYDLNPVSAWYSGFLTERDVVAEWPTARAHAEKLIALGCKVVVYGECGCGPLSGVSARLAERPQTNRYDHEAYAKRLDELAHRWADMGIALAYHHHMMQPVETAAQIEAVMRATSPLVGLLLDTGHLALAGDDYGLLMQRWWDRIVHIHLKDIRQNVLDRIDRSQITFNDGVRRGMFTVPGDGDLDFGPLAQQIKTQGYDGWLLVEAEQDPVKAPPAAMAQTAYATLTQIFSAQGLTFDRNPRYDATS